MIVAPFILQNSVATPTQLRDIPGCAQQSASALLIDAGPKTTAMDWSQQWQRKARHHPIGVIDLAADIDVIGIEKAVP